MIVINNLNGTISYSELNKRMEESKGHLSEELSNCGYDKIYKKFKEMNIEPKIRLLTKENKLIGFYFISNIMNVRFIPGKLSVVENIKKNKTQSIERACASDIVIAMSNLIAASKNINFLFEIMNKMF